MIKDTHKKPVITLHVVYFNPSDYPGKYVLREFVGMTPMPACVVKDTLEEIHALLPKNPNLFNLGPDAIDPVIIEVWI